MSEAAGIAAAPPDLSGSAGALTDWDFSLELAAVPAVTNDEIVTKFRRLADRVIDEPRACAFENLVLTLETHPTTARPPGSGCRRRPRLIGPQR